jgi:DNA-binding NarL/FixJ family response regulator
MINFAVIEDHPMVRDALKTFLNQNFTECSVLCYSNAKDFLLEFNRNSFDLIILDLSLPEINGFECVDEIKKRNPKQKVIAISAFADEIVIQKAVVNGCNSFLCKTDEENEIITCIKEVLKNGTYPSKWFLEVKDVQINPFCKLKLTNQEKEIFKLIAGDYTYDQITNILNVTTSTVDFHRKKLFEKTNSKNRSTLAKMATIFFFWENQKLYVK